MVKKNKKSGKNKFSNNDEAVSAVVGVILMVAITVVMAAIVSSWGSGVKAPASPPTIGLDIERSTTNITYVVTAIDPASAGPIPIIVAKYTNSTNSSIVTFANVSSADVGATVILQTNETAPGYLVMTATFKDGSKKVLYSQGT
jgi:flagellin-like protein